MANDAPAAPAVKPDVASNAGPSAPNAAAAPNATPTPNASGGPNAAAAPNATATPNASAGQNIVANVPAAAPIQRPSEPAFQLKLEPDQFVAFKADKITEVPVEVNLVLSNPTKDLHVYKVKCTSNEIFRVRSPLSYVKPESSITIKLTLQTKAVPEEDKHFFAIYHMACTDKDTTKAAKQRWTPASKPDGVKRIHVKFLKNDGTPWNSPAASAAPASNVPAVQTPSNATQPAPEKK